MLEASFSNTSQDFIVFMDDDHGSGGSGVFSTVVSFK